MPSLNKNNLITNDMIDIIYSSFKLENIDESFFKNRGTDLFLHKLSWNLNVRKTNRRFSECETDSSDSLALEIVQENTCVFRQSLVTKLLQIDGGIHGNATLYLRDLRDYPLTCIVSQGEESIKTQAVLPEHYGVIEYFCGYPTQISSTDKRYSVNLYWEIKDAASAILSYGNMYETKVPLKLKDSMTIVCDIPKFMLTIIKKDGEKIVRLLHFYPF